MNTATIKGMRELAATMRANRTKIVRVLGDMYEVRREQSAGLSTCIGRCLTLAGAEELARLVKP